MIRILFTGGGGAGSEALFRLLGEKYEVHFGDADVVAIDPMIPEDRRHELPWASDPLFVDKMSDLCRRLNIDLLIPGVDEELLALARNADSFSPTRLLLPDSSFVETMLDKLYMVRALAEKDILVPASQTLAENIDNIHYPCISKPRQGRGSRDVRVLNSCVDAESLRHVLGSSSHQMLMQEKIEGVEYTVQMVADAHGQLFAVVPVRVGIKRGITIRAETDPESNVISACIKMHHAIPAGGCYNIQLMLTPEGLVFPFEINPRVSTTLCLVVAAGVDPISIFYGLVKPETGMPLIPKIQLQRHWKNYFFRK